MAMYNLQLYMKSTPPFRLFTVLRRSIVDNEEYDNNADMVNRKGRGEKKRERGTK